MVAWLISLLIAGPTALAGGPVVHHAHDPRIDCIVQRFGDPEPQRCSSRLVCTTASKHLVGHGMVRARQIAHRYGCTVRVERRNGDDLVVHADLQPHRIDLSVKHWRIVRIVEIG